MKKSLCSNKNVFPDKAGDETNEKIKFSIVEKLLDKYKPNKEMKVIDGGSKTISTRIAA
tara:strand:- start:1612 stop:1788 length:177 start_codon:yes stop_codon:yes gene_type:complete